MTAAASTLSAALRQPAAATDLTGREWDRLIRQARKAAMLSRLHLALEDNKLLDRVPERPLAHLESNRLFADRLAIDVAWEVAQIKVALAPLDLPIVLLKGAAYTLAQLPPAAGRIFFDVDILVPKSSLEAVERQLSLKGWSTGPISAYDSRYYRTWMHELPPLRHYKRKTYLDVHHTILPETAPYHPDPQKLLAAAQPIPGRDGLFALAPADMVIHAATHLFHEGEFDKGLRDLSDLDALLSHFGTDVRFWDSLVPRAKELELSRPLFYALRYARAVLGTAIPDDVIDATRACAPSRPLLAMMDFLFDRGLRPNHPTCDDAFSGLARWLLYIRAHALRMPPHLLLPHLVRKAYMGHFG